MKTLTQKEILELVRTKKLSFGVLKPYKEAEDKKELSNEELLIEAIYSLIDEIAKKDNKDILEAIKNQPRPVIKVENVIKEKERKAEKWEFDIIRNNNGFIASVEAREVE